VKKVVAVVAAYDEEDNVEPLARRLAAALASLPDCAWEMLFVVEGRDRTREILGRLAGELGGLRILYQEEPSGLGNAFRRGFAAVPADADLVVTLDADLNHQPEEIPRLIAALERTGADVVVGSRFLAASRVEGTPLWKRFLSGCMNVLMRYLYGVQVLDKTSGFRVYRAAALSSLQFENSNFAFLPEMLIHAHKAGLAIVEEPIHFIFRRRGESKLRFWRTSLSYLSLLRARFDRWSVAVPALLAAGVAVRAAAAFPVHKYAADADCLLSGMCAFKVLRGETPVFFSGLRIGSLESHATAALFALLGPSRLALALVPLLLGCLTLFVLHRWLRVLLGRRTACCALLFLAIPPPAYLFWTYMPNGYPMAMLLCALFLWLAARLARSGGGPAALFGLGLVGGLGLWHSFLTLGCLAPAALWLLWRRPGLLRPRPLLAVLTGLLLGAAPLIAFDVRYPLASLRGNFAARPAHGVAAMLGNTLYLVSDRLPELLAGVDPQGVLPPTLLQRLLGPAVLVIYAAAAAFFLALPALERRAPGGGDQVPFDVWLLFVAVVGAIVALSIASAAGELRGLTARYILPLALLLPGILAVFLVAVARWSRPVAVLLAACVLSFNLAGYLWPWQQRREAWRDKAADDERLVDRLARHGVQVAVGGFWTVYPINFLSHERILGIPCEVAADAYDVAGKLPQAPERWALVAPAGARGGLRVWVAKAGLAGFEEPVGKTYSVFYPRENPPRERAQPYLDRLRAVCGTALAGP
jgi:dolichol-phosphate mannosyltransferase